MTGMAWASRLFSRAAGGLRDPQAREWPAETPPLSWQSYDMTVTASRRWCAMRSRNGVLRLTVSDFPALASKLSSVAGMVARKVVHAELLDLAGSNLRLSTDPGHMVVCLSLDGSDLMRLPVGIATDLADWLEMAVRPGLERPAEAGGVRVRQDELVCGNLFVGTTATAEFVRLCRAALAGNTRATGVIAGHEALIHAESDHRVLFTVAATRFVTTKCRLLHLALYLEGAAARRR